MNVWGKFSEGGKWFFLILKQHQFLKYLDYDFLFSAAIFCFSPKNEPFWTFTSPKIICILTRMTQMSRMTQMTRMNQMNQMTQMTWKTG